MDDMTTHIHITNLWIKAAVTLELEAQPRKMHCCDRDDNCVMDLKLLEDIHTQKPLEKNNQGLDEKSAENEKYYPEQVQEDN